MKLVTKVPVTYADSINTLTTGIIEGKLVGNTQGFRFLYSSTFAYEYNSLDGFVIKSSSASYTKEQINALYDLVKAQIPLGLDYVDTTEYLYYLGMRVEMASTFNISVNDIEIVQ